MLAILTMLVPSLILIIGLVISLGLYVFIRKYFNLKIEKLKKEN